MECASLQRLESVSSCFVLQNVSGRLLLDNLQLNGISPLINHPDTMSDFVQQKAPFDSHHPMFEELLPIFRLPFVFVFVLDS